MMIRTRTKATPGLIFCISVAAWLTSCGSPVKNNTVSEPGPSATTTAASTLATTAHPTTPPTAAADNDHGVTVPHSATPPAGPGAPTPGAPPPPGPSSHSNNTVPAPIRVPLPLDGLFFKEFEVAERQLSSIIRESCGDGTLCLTIGKAVDDDPANDNPDSCNRVHFVRGAKDEGGRSYVTTSRGSEITLVLWSLCTGPAPSSDSGASQTPAP
ncbi:hypothetical protein MUY14_01450 [Amycolatopsis sp. FBCC-B4732]|uniref:hypothetical protein n=1 Tax=Amycolatopsis sp. FBCC-B4732 TaxID=3079339 RepID=UPI001FF5D666|nr:hypothetical protein [Amycolatopsis sp. FBCC-B4732]UOX89337.1 hypothetical protein MUY14_01450 [Amycolatopsis sp. FBCC-B4732]